MFAFFATIVMWNERDRLHKSAAKSTCVRIQHWNLQGIIQTICCLTLQTIVCWILFFLFDEPPTFVVCQRCGALRLDKNNSFKIAMTATRKSTYHSQYIVMAVTALKASNAASKTNSRGMRMRWWDDGQRWLQPEHPIPHQLSTATPPECFMDTYGNSMAGVVTMTQKFYS